LEKTEPKEHLNRLRFDHRRRRSPAATGNRILSPAAPPRRSTNLQFLKFTVPEISRILEFQFPKILEGSKKFIVPRNLLSGSKEICFPVPKNFVFRFQRSLLSGSR
jgi:hypothetical protein